MESSYQDSSYFPKIRKKVDQCDEHIQGDEINWR